MNYILMNKDPAWLSFSCRRDEFDEVDLMLLYKVDTEG